MQLLKEEYARKRIHNGSSVKIENSVTRVTARHHLASLLMPNSYPRDGIFNQHLTTLILLCVSLKMCRYWHLFHLQLCIQEIRKKYIIEPTHEKRDLSIMHSYPVEPDLWLFPRIFLLFPVLCERTTKALARLSRCAGSPEPSLFA